MKNKFKIGIVGTGYVGSAIRSYFEQLTKVETFDKNVKCTTSSIQELVDKCNIIFVCVPTPMNKDGSTHINILFNVINEINEAVNCKNNKVVVIKSTIPVGTTNHLNNEFDKIKIIFNPEFLREVSFEKDFANQDRIILGSNERQELIYDLYKEHFPNAEIIETKPSEAEMVKYVTNSFLATKVSFANEIESFCTAKKINYKNIVKVAIKDKRLGHSHWDVPGPDGRRGFGGSCFPKDIASLIKQFKAENIDSYIISSAWQRNLKLDRSERDWEKLKKRAVI